MLRRVNRSNTTEYSQERVKFGEVQLAANLPHFWEFWRLFQKFLEHEPHGVSSESLGLDGVFGGIHGSLARNQSTN